MCNASFGSEVLSGLQYGGEKDCGSKAQPDIVDSLSMWDAEHMLSAGERQKQRPSIAPLGRAKGDYPRDCGSDAVIERDIKSTVQAK